jgi:transcriptional regulator with XRE-family HTH domain
LSEFSTRLRQACRDNPDIPEYGKGEQTYISQRLGVSQEAVRKWFAGDSKPKSAVGRKLAELLGVDYVWLALGTSHGEIEKRREAAGRQDAAVYALMSFLLEKGYSAAFDNDHKNIDIVTIYQGQQNHIAVRLAEGKKGSLSAAFSMSVISDISTIIAVRTNTFSLSFDFLWVRPEVWAKHATREGNEMVLRFSNPQKKKYTVGGTKLTRYLDGY